MDIAIYTLTSELHDEKAVGVVTQEFLSCLGIDYVFKGNDYADYGSHTLSVIYVRTGGTEGIFKRLLPQLKQQQPQSPFYLLTSGKSNSGCFDGDTLISSTEQHAGRNHSRKFRLYCL